jgi:intracellular septation protein
MKAVGSVPHTKSNPMKLLVDFFPIVLFFVGYKLGDIYIATLAAIAGAVIQVAFTWIRTRRFETMHLISLVLIVVFGGATWFLRDPTFIKWKPTVLNWLFAVVFLGSQWIGKAPIIQRMMGAQLFLPDFVWRRLNLAWTFYFIVIGGVNLYVAFNFEESVWVNFKLFGMLGLTFAFVLLQSFFLAKHMPADAPAEDK